MQRNPNLNEPVSTALEAAGVADDPIQAAGAVIAEVVLQARDLAETPEDDFVEDVLNHLGW